jgi:hypothetical protein
MDFSINSPNASARGHGFRSTEALGFHSSRFTRHIPESRSRRAFASKGTNSKFAETSVFLM